MHMLGRAQTVALSTESQMQIPRLHRLAPARKRPAWDALSQD